MYKITSKYYGTAGPVFIENLIQNYSKENYVQLEKKFEEIKQKL